MINNHVVYCREPGSHHAVDGPRNILEKEIKDDVGELSSHLNEVMKHILAIRGLKTRLNSLSSISRLPPKILTKIFLEYKALHIPKACDSCAWQSISHVCHYWRTVALGCPLLWTWILPSADDDCIEEFLNRSNGLPLIVPVAALPSSCDEKFLAANMARIETLHLTIHAQTTHMSSAPSLRNFVVKSNWRSTYDINLNSTIIYGDAAPQLRELTITSVPFEWHRFRHTNIRHLRIIRPEHPVGSSLKTIVDMLCALPLLEVLVLLDCMPTNTRPSQQGDSIATLRHLHSVAISGNTFACVNLLSYLDFPSDSSVRLCGHKAESAEAVVPYITKFTQTYTMQCLTVSKYTNALRFAPVTEPHQPLTTTHYDDLMDIRTLPEVIIFFPYEAFLTICKSVPLSGVVELVVLCAYCSKHLVTTVETIVKAFGSVPTIRTLYIRNKIHGEVLDYLDAPAQIDDSIILALPNLQELKLEYASLQEVDVDILVAYLNGRRGHGRGIQKIAFLRSAVDDKIREVAMPRLQEIVPTVIWEPMQDSDFLSEYIER